MEAVIGGDTVFDFRIVFNYSASAKRLVFISVTR